MTLTEDIIAIKDNISTVGDECEKIFLFGSYAYGTPQKDSDYDFYVVLKDGIETPIIVMQKIYEYMCDTKYVPVDVLANYKSRFEQRSTQPTIERTIEKKELFYMSEHDIVKEWLRYANVYTSFPATNPVSDPRLVGFV